MTATDRLREPGLLTRQFASYPHAHRDRRNLTIHVTTQPLFVSSLAAALAGPWIVGWVAVPFGVFGMVLAMALQGRGHRLEARPPDPFRGPLDVVARIFAEQLVTFPRYVLTGGFARAWRESAKKGPT